MVYYLDRDDVRGLADRVGEAAAPGCDILLVHWLGETHYPLSGDAAADWFIEGCAAHLVEGRRDKDYRLDILRLDEGRTAT